MALEADEVRVFGDGHIYVAPVGTAFPANVAAPVSAAAGWVELGYVSEEGARFNFSRETQDIPAWQAFEPIKTLVTSVPKEVSFDLLQFNRYGWALALGGGVFTEPSPGNYHWEPPSPGFVDERALLVEMIDTDYTYRFGFRRAVNKAGIEFAGVRSDVTKLAITMSGLAANVRTGAGSWFVDTDDPNFADLLQAAS